MDPLHIIPIYIPSATGLDLATDDVEDIHPAIMQVPTAVADMDD